VTITGKITGKNPTKVEYSVPINGVCYLGFSESAQSDSLGNFQIRIKVDKPAFISISVSGEYPNKMVIEHGVKYKVAIDMANNANKLTVLSPNEKGQEFYRSLPNPSFVSMDARKLNKDTTVLLLKTKITTLKEAELSHLKKLLASNEITPAFYKLVEADRNCYYSAILSSALISKFSRSYIEHPADYPADMNQLLNSIFVDYPANNKQLDNSSFWYEYAESYLNFKEYVNKDFNLQELRDVAKKGFLNTHNIAEAQKRLTEPNLEYFKAVHIYFTAYQKRYERELISLFDQFKKDYPHSSFTKYLEPQITPIVEYYQKLGQPMNSQIKFVENYQKLNSLKEAVAQFKGQKVFVDVWATWCKPCKEEFQYKDKLQALLKKNNIQVVYISIDKDDQEKQWKDMISFYNLEGYHIRTNEKLYTDLIKLYNQNGMIAIPWYILIDENGNIIKEHSARPSELDKLETEITNK
jgi:thiol-disulfide isomerase/thioredoxin